jgi:hypothetical protein
LGLGVLDQHALQIARCGHTERERERERVAPSVYKYINDDSNRARGTTRAGILEEEGSSSRARRPAARIRQRVDSALCVCMYVYVCVHAVTNRTFLVAIVFVLAEHGLGRLDQLGIGRVGVALKLSIDTQGTRERERTKLDQRCRGVPVCVYGWAPWWGDRATHTARHDRDPASAAPACRRPRLYVLMHKHTQTRTDCIQRDRERDGDRRAYVGRLGGGRTWSTETLSLARLSCRVFCGFESNRPPSVLPSDLNMDDVDAAVGSGVPASCSRPHRHTRTT